MCKTTVHVYAHKSKMTVICCMHYDCYNLQRNKGWQLIPAEQLSQTNHNAVSISDKEESWTFSLHEHPSAASPCASVLCAQSDKRNFALRRL